MHFPGYRGLPRPRGTLLNEPSHHRVGTQCPWYIHLVLFILVLSLLSSPFFLQSVSPISLENWPKPSSTSRKDNGWNTALPLEGKHATKTERGVLVTALFGEKSITPLLHFFLKTACHSGFDVVLFGDQRPEIDVLQTCSAHVRHIFLSWANMTQRITELVPECAAGLAQIDDFSSHRKVIDLKPLFGAILQKELNMYTTWAHIDNDMVLGRLNKLIPKKTLASSEVLPMTLGRSTFGPLTFFANTARVNNLFRRAPRLCDMLADPTPWGFDEWFGPANNTMDSIVEEAQTDLSFNLRVAPDSDRFHSFWDGNDSGSSPRSRNLICEVYCPQPAGPCTVYRGCRANTDCTRHEMAFCHFQFRKKKLNQRLAEQNASEVAALLSAPVLWIDHGVKGVHEPTPAQLHERSLWSPKPPLGAKHSSKRVRRKKR